MAAVTCITSLDLIVLNHLVCHILWSVSRVSRDSPVEKSHLISSLEWICMLSCRTILWNHFVCKHIFMNAICMCRWSLWENMDGHTDLGSLSQGAGVCRCWCKSFVICPHLYPWQSRGCHLHPGSGDSGHILYHGNLRGEWEVYLQTQESWRCVCVCVCVCVFIPLIWQSTGAGMQARAVENSKRTSWTTWSAKELISSRSSFNEPGWEFGSHTKLMVKVSRVADEEGK